MQPRRRPLTLVALVMTVLLAGCAAGAAQQTKDAAGLTQDDVAELTLHEEFDRYRDRYRHMQQLLEEAQNQVHRGDWEWDRGDDLPLDGSNGVAPLPGSTVVNSYYLRAPRSWAPPGASGAKRDLDPMLEHFRAKRWTFEVRARSGSHEVRAWTGDGWQIQYSLDVDGRYSLDVYSEPFWTNDSDALSAAVYGRATLDWPTESRPGEYPTPPTWDDPVVNHPKT
ncbi:hypothetical protein DEJ16_01575 [Curtobacterium sp. MCJR17_055]|uniref:hypothetical protein n=2 Tax=Curtobacterium TaxID=2034 RepID=UPI000D9DB737|nr:hypothetical protein [Curtobacterium sp. MCJR17_043]PYY36925.1 hypothetical protein DEI87_04570 [Curtobacterium sp. MCBD17_029]PYY57964.1 hypothetical protein DEJ26_10265 [Curtobacterium sp. MCPF17_015]PYY58415.1 hypothetical protein DEJ16_01575 [Curtobacterium sp. MCJR17_055]WIB36706.1 hypothetical protein DEJ15_06515 [Curtobacterium sp. MCJR17_043]